MKCPIHNIDMKIKKDGNKTQWYCKKCKSFHYFLLHTTKKLEVLK